MTNEKIFTDDVLDDAVPGADADILCLRGGEADPGESVIEDAGTVKRVYFAGPLFNQPEKDFNLRIAAVLEECGYEVFLPQRDGIEAA